MLALFGGMAIWLLVVVLAVVVALYIVMGLYLNKLNEIEYGKKTCFAWIPILNFYLLGKLAVNKFVGWILVLSVILTGSSETTINGVTTTSTILPEPFNTIFSAIYSVAVIVCLIVVIVKYNRKKTI